jgi:hypothetical protein
MGKTLERRVEQLEGAARFKPDGGSLAHIAFTPKEGAFLWRSLIRKGHPEAIELYHLAAGRARLPAVESQLTDDELYSVLLRLRGG